MPTLTQPEARSRFAAARVARLATLDTDGPHLVPVVFALDGDTIVMSIDHKPKARREVRRLDNIRANPAVTLLVDHYADDWSTLWWVRADGRAVVVPDAPVDALVAKYPQYQEIRPAGPMILVTVTRWTAWTATQPPV